MNIFSQFKNDFSLSALVAGLIVVLVGMTSSAIIVFQAATAFGASATEASSWLGSLCVGMGILTIYFSLKHRNPILMAWSTPGAVLLVSGAAGFSMAEAIGAFLFSSILIFIFGVTGWFEKIMSRISLSLTSALLAGVLLHFCLEAFASFNVNPLLVGGMFLAYIFAKRLIPRLTMLMVLVAGLLLASTLGLFHFDQVHLGLTSFHFIEPRFTFASLVSLGIPLFIVTMASQNLTGIAVMRANGYENPVSPLVTGMGAMNFITSFFGGFTINLAAITAAIAVGPEAHSDHRKRYVAAVIAGFIYLLVGIFAASVTSLFAAFPAEMISAIAGFALLGTVGSSLEIALADSAHKESAFITFALAASGLSFYGISSAFWAVLVGLFVQLVFTKASKVR